MAVSMAAKAVARQRRHVIISGTGRAGTTFLVELLTHLGLATGFTPHTVASNINAVAHAGLEHDVRKEDAPYVVKSPGFCDYAAEVLAREDIRIEHVFVPFRDLYEAAESRRQVQEKNIALWSLLERIRNRKKLQRIKGGLWQTTHKEAQETVLLGMIYKLFLALSDTNIPVTLLRYPKALQDGRYLYEKIKPILGGISYAEFKPVFDRTVNPGLIHAFDAG
jgi:hypothetical protein